MRIKYVLASLLLLILLLIFLTPTFLSTQPGKRALVGYLNRQLPDTTIAIDELSLSWFSSQKISGFSVEEKKKSLMFSSKTIQTSASLVQILMHRPDLDHPFPLKLSGEFILTGGKLTVLNNQFDDLEVQIQIPKELSSGEIKAWGKTQGDNQQGHFAVCTKFDELHSKVPSLNIQAELVDLPIKTVDQIATLINPDLRGLLIEGIGNRLTLTLHGDLSREKLDCDFKIDSPNLKGSIQTELQNETIVLTSHQNIDLLFTPAFAEKISNLFEPLRGLALKNSTKALFAISSFSLPLTPQGLDFKKAAFEIGFNLAPTRLSSTLTKQEISLKELHATLKTASLEKGIDVTLSTLAAIDAVQSSIQMRGKLENLMGNSLRVEGRIEAEKLSMLLIEQMLQLKGKLVDFFGTALDAKLDFVLGDQKRQATVELSSSQFKLAPSTFSLGQEILLLAPTHLIYSLPSKFQERIGKQLGPIELKLNTLKVKEEKDLTKISAHALFPFADTQIALDLDGKNRGAHLNLSATSSAINLTLIGNSSPLEQNVQLKATGREFHAHAELTLKDNRLFLSNPREPLELFFTLTKEGYQAVDRWLTKEKKEGSPFELAQPSVISLTLSHLNCPLPEAETSTLDLASLNVEGEIRLDKFAFLDKTSRRLIKLDQPSIQFGKTKSTEPFSLHMSSSILTKLFRSDTAPSQEGLIQIDGKIDQLFTNRGLGRLHDCTADISFALKQVPSVIFDLFARMGGYSSPVSPVFGDNMSLDATLNMKQASGPIRLTMHSPNARFSLSGAFKAGTLTLLEPIYGQITMTPELSNALLKEINPLSIRSISAKNPLTLEIANQGFSLSLFPFDKTKMQIPNTRIELGQIQCQNEGAINTTLGLLKSKQLASASELELWFTPIDLHVQNGSAEIERTEILVSNTFEIASWGKVDFAHDSVDMVLGLTAQCLNKAFGIRDLPSDYVLQIPMRGKMDNVEMSSTAATTKIAALLLWQQKSSGGTFGKGITGAIAGDLLGKIGVLPDMNETAPPAKHPFPWETNKPNGKPRKKETSKAESSFKKKNKIKKTDKPLKQLLKILK